MARQRTRSKRAKRSGKRWSARVTRESDALTLEKRVFTKSSPRKIAASLKRSADRSQFQFASLCNVHVDLFHQPRRQGLSKSRKQKLEQAKKELREVYGKA